ncbi:MAG: hypothetical protein HQL16_07680 [Candidatus Omnitrophica bacterium]|nr:hypothetical protein [Candidatus Omnitrophota bacterium]
MFKVIAKHTISTNFKRIDIKAENLAVKLKPGQFVTVMPDRFSRRIPFNVFEVDWPRKCLSIVFEEKDAETVKLGAMKLGEDVFAVSGPYGLPSPIEKIPQGAVVCVGEGLGLSSLVPFCRSFKQVGVKVVGVAGFETRKTSILENQMRLYCNKFYVMYKDGMHERKGDILEPLKKVMAEENVVRVYADTSIHSLLDVDAIAREKGVELFVNLMPLISDGQVFFETSHVFMNGQKYYPAVDGIMIKADKVDLKEVVRAVDSAKEYAECRKKENALLSQPNAFGRFKKFVWG